MILDHEHQHPPSTKLAEPSTFTLVSARIAVWASLVGIALVLVQSGTRVLW